MSFVYRTCNGAKLTLAQETFLDTIENLPSPFGDISKLKDLRDISGVSVIVANRRYLINYLEEYVKTYREKSEDFFHGNKDFLRYHENQGEVGDRLRWAEDQLRKAKEHNPKTVPLLGLYSRKLFWYTSDAPTVYLFADNIRDYAERIGRNADHVFGYVFIHEMMHAYYDAFNNVGYPATETLEETFAEFGMLSFISKTFGLCCDFLDDAINHVLSKIENGPREYGFGYEMFGRTWNDAPELIERYKDISNWINYPVLNAAGINYHESIRAYQQDPKDKNADKCYEDVLEILDLELTEPSFSIQPGIKKSSSLTPASSSITHTPTTSSRKGYEIIDIASGKVIASGVSMARVPLTVISDFCDKNKGIDFSGLQKIFGTIRPYNLPSGMGIIVRIPDIIAYKTRTADRRNRYYEDDPIPILANTDNVYVTNQWTSDGNFPEFVGIAKMFGYDIIP